MHFSRFLTLFTAAASVLATTSMPRAQPSAETPPLARGARQVVGYTENVRLFPHE